MPESTGSGRGSFRAEAVDELAIPRGRALDDLGGQGRGLALLVPVTRVVARESLVCHGRLTPCWLGWANLANHWRVSWVRNVPWAGVPSSDSSSSALGQSVPRTSLRVGPWLRSK